MVSLSTAVFIAYSVALKSHTQNKLFLKVHAQLQQTEIKQCRHALEIKRYYKNGKPAAIRFQSFYFHTSI